MPTSKAAGVVLGILLGGASIAAGQTSQDTRRQEIKTEPPDAEVYLDWQLLGQTPLTLEHTPPAGAILVVVREGYTARSRTIDQPRSFYFRLREESPIHPRRVLLRIVGPESDAFQELLIEELAQKDFFVHPESDVAKFELRLQDLGDRARKPLLAWARAEFNTHSWVVVRLPGVAPELDPSDRLIKPVAPLVERIEAEPLPSEHSSAHEMLIGSTPSGGEASMTGEDSATVRVLDLRQGSLDEEFRFKSQSFYSQNSQRRAKAERELAQAIASTLLDWAETQAELTQPDSVTAVDLSP